MRTSAAILLMVVLLFGVSPCVWAERYWLVTTKHLIEKTKYFDAQGVVLEGQVIGDIMRRKENAWINLQDAHGVIGVWLPLSEAKKITYAGDYQHSGDIVKVWGLFFRANQELQGEFCIKADQLQVIRQGSETPHALSHYKITMVAILGGLALILLGFKSILRKKQEV